MMPESNASFVTFAGLPYRPDVERMDAAVAVLGAENATPYRAGQPSQSAGSPASLRAAIRGYGRNPDHFDFDLGSLPSRNAVDCGDIPTSPDDPSGNRERIASAVRALLDQGATPIVLGGDDSVPIPVLQAFEGRGPLTVLQIDAHLDWRDEVEGERYGYSSPMRRAPRWVGSIGWCRWASAASAARGPPKSPMPAPGALASSQRSTFTAMGSRPCWSSFLRRPMLRHHRLRRD